MHNATDFGFDCPMRRYLGPAYDWTVEIRLRGKWEPTDSWATSREGLADDVRHWHQFYPQAHIRVVHRPEG